MYDDNSFYVFILNDFSLVFKSISSYAEIAETGKDRPVKSSSLHSGDLLTHWFPMYLFSTPENRKPNGFLMFSEGRERCTGNKWVLWPVKKLVLTYHQLFLCSETI